MLVHATCVAVEEDGILIRGPSGSGKSDLALRLIDEGAVLVADDQTEVEVRNDCVMAACPVSIAGMLEVRGLGIVSLDWRASCSIRLVVDLVPQASVERHPEIEDRLCHDFGPPLPRVALAPFEASATAKLRLALALALRDTPAP
jgi:serine kinase of HPr protein (carbohydrate metabolism regulator)